MKLLSLLPLLYSQKLFGTQGLFKNRDFANTGATTHAQNQQELGLQKMQEPHEQRNRQEEKPRKHSSPKLHKSKRCAKVKSTITRLNNNRNHRKEHSESSLHQLTGSVFLSLKSPSDTVIPKCENFWNIVRRHRYLKTPDHTQCISPQLPSLIRRLKKMHGTHSASDDATTDRATVRADR